jgi:hypothetical protein
VAAVPFTVFTRNARAYEVGAQMIELGPPAPRLADTVPASDYIERAIFLDGRLVLIGHAGVVSVDYAGRRRIELERHNISVPLLEGIR